MLFLASKGKEYTYPQTWSNKNRKTNQKCENKIGKKLKPTEGEIENFRLMQNVHHTKLPCTGSIGDINLLTWQANNAPVTGKTPAIVTSNHSPPTDSIHRNLSTVDKKPSPNKRANYSGQELHFHGAKTVRNVNSEKAVRLLDEVFYSYLNMKFSHH